ncbi:hypothetical protein CNMCM8927_000724 [Aspergillus lentulus]|uniref:Carrier domain-containing protein n=1 Tax=Aspergillus lentulus TaxID=293939 RepID=A0AAN6BLJ1_ASPLE|nr:hypothetical protein CNMCM8060_006273 [Aspergillus lentulus]KAF4180424.1 hypothetical protein CNMCM7927_001182 [Aspergillus lentulus]KAF4202019.1 hypothetical protein CNMCM8927_000724 [Aspergillus lentulus]
MLAGVFSFYSLRSEVAVRQSTASVSTGIIGRVVILNDFTITHMPRSGTELPPPVSGSAAGYNIFTSGSTAIRLIQRGAGPEVFVPIHTERSKWTLVALLAVVKAGAAFTLFDPSHPQEQTTLPVSRYMVPMAYVPLPDCPTNKSMKTDRPQLRDLAIRWSQEEMAGRPSEEKTPPRTAREQTIQKLVSQTLHLPVDQVGLIDNLIMLGGDSFHAVKLLSIARGRGDSPELDAAASAPTSNTRVSSATQPCGLLGINDAGAFIRDTIAPQIEFTADSILDVLPTTEFQAEGILDWPLSYFVVTMHGPLDKTRLRAALNAMRSTGWCRQRPQRIPCRGREYTVLDLLQNIQMQHIDAIEYETTGMCEIGRVCPAWPEHAPLGCLTVDVTPQFALGSVECSTRMFGGEFKRHFLHVVTSSRGHRTVVQIFAPSWLMNLSWCKRVIAQLCKTANPLLLVTECPDQLILKN